MRKFLLTVGIALSVMILNGCLPMLFSGVTGTWDVVWYQNSHNPERSAIEPERNDFQ